MALFVCPDSLFWFAATAFCGKDSEFSLKLQKRKLSGERGTPPFPVAYIWVTQLRFAAALALR